ncbi:response regulator transcription factor [Hahella sp. HN01]|uniref:response regulator n=1 Tax=Hahella sp. HN01 TaxID=2847262 RepID=UPI001C1E9A4B|nr:response regulator transcription factor [Hahella sp. HN01]MBU6951616.1 response regulator transcription factor [Hahella sp. HN01]
MTKINVFLADDHDIVISGLRDMLCQYPHIDVVGHASTEADLMENASREDVNVFVVDLGFKGTKGDISLIRRLKERNEHIRVVIFSMRENIHTISGCYTMGAQGYVKKSASLKLVVEAIETVAQGDDYFAPGVLESIGMKAVRDPLRKLDDREKQIFLMFAQGSDMTEVASELNLSEKRINNLITEKIKPVLGVSRTGFRECAIRLGVIDDIDD